MYANIFVVMGVSMEKISYEKFVKLVNSFDDFNEKLLFALYEKYGKEIINTYFDKMSSDLQENDFLIFAKKYSAYFDNIYDGSLKNESGVTDLINHTFYSLGTDNTSIMNQNEEIRVLYVQPGKYPEEIKIPNTLETFQKYVCGSIESIRLDRDAYIICNDEGKLLPLPPNRLYGPTDFFAGPFLICGDGGEDLISLTDSQITKYEKNITHP